MDWSEVINKLNEINTVESHIINEQIKNIEGDEDLFPLLDFLVDSYRSSRTQQILQKNEQVAEAIRWFVQEGLWVNISQMRRVLLGDLEKALKTYETTVRKSNITQYYQESIEIEKALLNVPFNKKKEFIESLCEEE